MSPAPACIFGPRFDYVAWNDSYGSLWHPDALPPCRRNVLWLALCDLDFRRVMPGWKDRGRVLLREFRAASGQHAGDARFAELIAALQDASPEFREWWPTYDVGGSIAGLIGVRHPTVGSVWLDVNELRLCTYPSLTLSVQVPQRPADAIRLERLLRVHRDPSPHPVSHPGRTVPAMEATS